MRHMVWFWIVATIFLYGVIITSGCGHSELVVESDTEWAGWHNNEEGGVERVSGIRGNKTFIGSDCGEFQMVTKYGYIRAEVKQKGLLNRKPEDVARADTAYGVVRVCAGN